MTTKLTAEQRVQKSHVALMNNPKYCMYAGIFMLGKTEVRDDIPTAATDGRNTYYGRKFVAKQDDRQLKGLILHENLHKAFRHTTVWKHLYKLDKRKANMACDYVINLMIVDSDKEGKEVALPDGGCYDTKYRGMDAGEVFRKLQEEEKDKEKDKDKKGGQGGENDGSGDQGEEEPTGFDEHDWDAADEMSEADKQELAREIDQALRQGALLAGRMKGGMPRELTEAMEAKINWREVLRDFVNSVCADRDNSTWRRPNRRWVDQDVYMPSVIGEAVGRILVGIDTSGSIGQAEIGQFLGELLSICNHVQPEGIDLVYWDTEVASHEKYDRGDYEAIMSSTKPAGGGGTDPSCVPQYIAAKKMNPECVIMLTDGYVGSWGKWAHPVFWGITTKRITADCGVSVYVGD
jgi:predicted metal-dependent peptidase